MNGVLLVVFLGHWESYRIRNHHVILLDVLGSVLITWSHKKNRDGSILGRIEANEVSGLIG